MCGLGKADGICGINCRHSYYPYFEGMSRHYDAEAVAALSKKEYAYTSQDGEKHEYTRYEAEQAQRRIERQIRRYKKRVAVFESAGLQNPEAKARLGEWQAVARDFVKQTGLRRDYAREYVGVERTLWNQGQAQPRGSNAPLLSSPFASNPSSSTAQSTTKGFITGYKKKSFDEKQTAREDWLIRKGIASGKERMILTDTKGNILAIAKGKEHTVNPNERIIDVLSHTKDKTVDMAHNHPSGLSFSPEDLITLNANTSIRTLSAIGHNGEKYYMSIPKGKEADENKIVSIFNEMSLTAKKEAYILLASGKLKATESKIFIYDKINELVAKYFGWKYKRGAE